MVRPRLHRFGVSTFLCSLLLMLAVSAFAEEPPRKLSDYEAESVRIALDQVDGTLEPEAQGKIVESIEVVTLDVIEPRDPAPLFLNWLHGTTRDYVIEREVLLREGRAFDRGLADETERNLRSYPLSVVLVVPLKGSAPDRVRVLVITKDVWSLRMSWEPSVTNGKLTGLDLQPSEINLLGTAQAIFGNLEFGVNTYVLGGGFSIPRLAGSRLRVSAQANAVINCGTGHVEGSNGLFQFSRPLYATSTKWSWGTAASWSAGIARTSSERDRSICSGGEAQLVALRVPDTPRGVLYPFSYSFDSLAAESSVTRSFFRLNKINISVGLESSRFAAEARRDFDDPLFVDWDLDNNRVAIDPITEQPVPATDLPSPARQEQELTSALGAVTPASSQRISPFVQLSAFKTQYQRMINLNTLGLQEDYQVGHSVGLKVYPASTDFGSSRDLLGISSSVSYTWPFFTGLFSAGISNAVELSFTKKPAADGSDPEGGYEESDAVVDVSATLITPTLGFGRFVYSGLVRHRYRNFHNSLSSIGGTGRLRGYVTGAFFGPDVVVSNLEFRTSPLKILNVLFGAAVFYDVGDAFSGFDNMRLKQGGGAGLRFLAPQLDRKVFRIDFGFPLTPNEPLGEFTSVARFNQAF